MPTCLVMKRSSGRLSGGGGGNLQSFNDYLSLESDWGEVSSHAKFFFSITKRMSKKVFHKKSFLFCFDFFSK